MRLPEHLAALMALRRVGVPVHVAMSKGEIPVSLGRQLVLIGDDHGEGTGGGPDAWNDPKLRRLLRSLKPGVVGVFAGAPMPSAYEAISFAAATLLGGAVIIEAENARFLEWYTYTQTHAPYASRYDVLPWGLPPPPRSLFLGPVER